MKIKNYLIALLVILVLGVCGALFLLPAPQNKADVVAINDVTATLSEHFDQLGPRDYLLPKSDYDYTVIDAQGNVLQATRQGLSEDIFAALRHGDMVMDITKDGDIVGKVLFYNESQAQWQAYRNSLQILAIAVMVVLAAITVIFFVSINRQLSIYFKILKNSPVNREPPK